ncbi:hypothetical protein TNCV_3537231 [Trichonephila clavipes]|nr:hypothetical protein TNCV_3537231 [Trichonephila clavipes]
MGREDVPQSTKRSNEAERLRGEGKNAERKAGRPKAVNQGGEISPTHFHKTTYTLLAELFARPIGKLPFIPRPNFHFMKNFPALPDLGSLLLPDWPAFLRPLLGAHFSDFQALKRAFWF